MGNDTCKEEKKRKCEAMIALAEQEDAKRRSEIRELINRRNEEKMRVANKILLKKIENNLKIYWRMRKQRYHEDKYAEYRSEIINLMKQAGRLDDKVDEDEIEDLFDIMDKFRKQRLECDERFLYVLESDDDSFDFTTEDKEHVDKLLVLRDSLDEKYGKGFWE